MQQTFFAVSNAGFSFFITIRAVYFLITRNLYKAFCDFCWLARVSNVSFLKSIGANAVHRVIRRKIDSGSNALIESFRGSSSAKRYENKYTEFGIGEQDIFRDIIVLKAATDNEKGVVLLKYAITFEALLLFFDVEKLLERFIFVLEPCWAGFYNSNILMWIFPKYKNRVFVQCYTQNDYEIVEKYKPYLIPIKMGPADWVNSDIFRPDDSIKKEYDIIMVANWAKGKNHFRLFNALKKLKNREISVLLIGYKWGGRTKDDILQESKRVKNPLIKINIKENLPHNEVVQCLNRSKIFVFLSNKEGDNKALVEAMFTGTPVIVYKDTVGGAALRVNEMTGIFSDFHDLHLNIEYMLDNFKKYHPRDWAFENTGSTNTTKRLNSILKKYAGLDEDPYTKDITEKINSPNLAYRDQNNRITFGKEYQLIKNHRLMKDSKMVLSSDVSGLSCDCDSEKIF